jgi:hypothetical protein
LQNNRTDNQITDLKPLYVKDGELDYDYEEGNVFEGGNEFRTFDTRTIKFLTQYTEKITQDTVGDNYQFYLKRDQKKSYQHYSITDDINGRFLIKTYDGRDADLEADYVTVHFRLPVAETLDQGNLFLYGQLTDWNLTPAGKLKYDEDGYSQSLLVKQGYYNYQYLFLRDTQKKAETVYTEGDHFEAGNDYSFFVYWKSVGGRYDQLVGYKFVDTTIH